jgi:hypothetical protein
MTNQVTAQDGVGPTDKLGWEQLYHVVKQLSADQQAAQRSVLSHFAFTADSTHVFFLAAAPPDREHSLYAAAIATARRAGRPLEWHAVLLDSGRACGGSASGVTREEAMLRERQRAALVGITQYELDVDARRILFSRNGALHIADLGQYGAHERQAVVVDVPTALPGARVDAKLCPADPNLMAFVHRGDLWVQRLDTGEELRLTYARADDDGSADDAARHGLGAGIPEYVMQEEFNRYTGYWFAGPAAEAEEGGVHRILYTEVDESAVPVHTIALPCGRTEAARYPFAGAANATTDLCVAEFSWCGETFAPVVARRRLYRPLRELLPWHEYVVRAGWFPGGQRVWAQLLDRPQQRTVVVAFTLDHFVYEDSHGRAVPPPPPQVVLDETSPVWISVTDALAFVHVEGALHVVWASERSGHRHLYLIPCAEGGAGGPWMPLTEVRGQGARGSGGGMHDKCKCASTEHGAHLHVLQGSDVVVEPERLWTDEARGLLYFLAVDRGAPLEVHLYAVSYRRPQYVQEEQYTAACHVSLLPA